MLVPCRLLRSRGLAFAAVVISMAGCVSAPVFNNVPAASPAPAEVALAPERYHGAEVVWAGKILDVRNRADTTEVQVIAYPMDASQRPDQSAPTEGRFIVVLPGFIEPMDFPPGRFLSVRGHLDGTRVGHIDERDYVYPLLQRDALHLWPVNFPNERGRMSFGLGLGIGIR